VVQSAFDGRRVVIFSEGETKKTKKILAEIKELRTGGASGSIIGRNSFQQLEEDIALLHKIQDIFLS